jgi:aerobic carbon-monoxide dehydrogenase medium subunit
MKPAAFEYARPETLDEALSLLVAEDVRPIAGGQSLVPLLALRLVTPKRLVDLSRLAELRGIEIGPEGIRIGALTRWRDILSDRRLEQQHPLVVEAVKHTAHYQIRNRGTVGGSCCHADPAAEMPAIAVTCDAEFELISRQGRRMIPAREFLLGVFTTALRPDELLLAIRLPPWPRGRRYGFQEMERRTGDFAIAGCALFWDEEGGYCRDPHVGVFGVAETAVRVAQVESLLADKLMSEECIREAARTIAKVIDPPADLHATSAYRRALLAVLLERALKAASDQHPSAS